MTTLSPIALVLISVAHCSMRERGLRRRRNVSKGFRANGVRDGDAHHDEVALDLCVRRAATCDDGEGLNGLSAALDKDQRPEIQRVEKEVGVPESHVIG